MTEQSQEPLFQRFCYLRYRGEVDKARALITEAANLSSEEKAKIQAGRMGDYLLENSSDPQVCRMVRAEKAFWEFYYLYQNKGDISEVDINANIKQFDELAPFMNKQDVVSIKIHQDHLYDYVNPEEDDVRYNLLYYIIQNYPEDISDIGEVLLEKSRKIDSLRISPWDKYAAIKEARNRTPRGEKLPYVQLLGKSALETFNRYVNIALYHDMSDQNKIEYYEKALEVVDDIDVSQDVYKVFGETPAIISNKRQESRYKSKLFLYGRLEKLYKATGDIDKAAKINKQKRVLTRNNYARVHGWKGYKSYVP